MLLDEHTILEIAVTKEYNKTIGYSGLEKVDHEKMTRLVGVNKALITQYYSSSDTDIVLVAGTGFGEEAHQIKQQFSLSTIGVDINMLHRDNLLKNREGFYLLPQDVSALAFCDNVFSLVYSYHVLEHVGDPVAVLQEFKRVLCTRGVLFVGFPNKNRLFSYFGTSQRASLLEKIKWNLSDYGYRLKGRFENKYGAHAGFSQKEFLKISEDFFSEVHAVRDEYMLIKYSRLGWLIRVLVKSNLAEFLFPSNYFICIKD